MSEIVAEGIVEAATLRQYLSAMTAIVSDSRIHFNDDGLAARFVDAGNVAMATVDLDYQAFESYDAPGAATVGVSLTKLADKVKPASADTLVQLQVDMETRHLHVDYGRARQTLALIANESIRSEPDVPGLDLPNRATITGAELDEALTICDLIADHVDVRGTPDGPPLSFYTRGDTDDAEVSFTMADVLDAEVGDEVMSIFSLDYLKDLAKPIPADSEVTLTFGEEMPMRLRWGAIGGLMAVEYTQAPRIQKR